MTTFVYEHSLGVQEQVYVKTGSPFAFLGPPIFWLPFDLPLEIYGDRQCMSKTRLRSQLAEYRAALQDEIDEIDKALPKLETKEPTQQKTI